MDTKNHRTVVFKPSSLWPRTMLMLLFGFGIVLMAAAVAPRPAFAHSRVEVGPYVIVLGWEVEPVVVGERNALILDVTEDEYPVEGVEKNLDMVVLYAGRTYTANLSPTSTPGHYRADILPTVKGQYEVSLTGAIGDVSVDEVLEPEEVLSQSIIAFPETLPEVRDVAARVDDLESRLGTANTLAIGGVLAGLLGLGIAVLALRRSSSKS